MPKTKPKTVSDYRLSVLSYEKRDARCLACGEKTLVFVCHLFGLDVPDRKKIQEFCKSCAIKAAGAEEHVWVKTTFPRLRSVWATQKRPEKPSYLQSGRTR
jgi:hypothetical protein